MRKTWGILFTSVLLLCSIVLANQSPTQPTLTYPIGNEQLGERTNVTWMPSTDPDGDPIYYVLESSANGGLDWNIVDDEVGRRTRFADNTSEKDVYCRTQTLTDKYQNFFV